jgi:hypothetical protein
MFNDTLAKADVDPRQVCNIILASFYSEDSAVVNTRNAYAALFRELGGSTPTTRRPNPRTQRTTNSAVNRLTVRL